VAPSSKVLMAYVPEWKNMKTEQIPGEKLSHLLYAFSLVNEQGECTTFDAPESATRNLEMIKEVKARHPHLRIFISVGGWTGSANFSDAVLTPESRQKLVKSCIDMWIKGGVGVPGVIDGIDIDWEYPGAAGETPNFRPEDKQNFVALMAEIRRQLDELGATDGKRYLVSGAFGVTPAIVEAGLDLPALAKVMDYFNLMIYDLHGAGEPTGPTNFHNAMYPAADDPSAEVPRKTSNVDSVVQRFIAGGVAPGQVVIGLPFYGRGWKGVPNVNNGLFQNAVEAFGAPYSTIKTDYEPIYQKFRHPETHIPYIFSPEQGLFIAYDDPESAREKAEYAVKHGLAGAMFWEMSEDDPQFSLTNALHEGLGMKGSN
jgi:chitinase